MFKFKLLLKKDKIKVLLISGILSFISMLFNLTPNPYRNLSDFFCIMGLVLFFIGSTRYIRNVGLFKTFSYLAYKQRWKSHTGAENGLRPISLAEYTQTVVMDETRHLPVVWVMCIGAFCCLIALLLARLVA